jgi:hypothetical protein
MLRGLTAFDPIKRMSMTAAIQSPLFRAFACDH